MAKKDPKKIEKMLYQAYLDLYYADGDYADMIECMTESLKDLKARKRKTAKMFEKARKQYVDTYGKEPMHPKRGK